MTKRAVPLIILLLLAAILIIVPATAQESSSNITFQPNSIPDVDVYYEDYSFVFEYKSYFIRIRPFVIYNDEYYGMKKIVTWIKNNYPNVNYKVLVDKAVNAIHYGYNLTKLPQNVADKIDYLGFRLVDLNFPLSWFELEKILVTEDLAGNYIEPYNITRIYIPKANLVFSFEDLYPQGYSIQHVNKTYILIGEVKGKTDLIVDPITFSSPTITVIGGTEGSELGFIDIWNADQTGSWNVVHNNNNSGTQFEFNAMLVLGNGTVAGTTWFADTSKQIVFNAGIVTANWQDLFRVRNYATLTLGLLVDDATKRTELGCTIQFLETTYYLDFLGDSGSKINLYGCFIIGERVSYHNRVRFNIYDGKVYNTNFDNLYSTGHYPVSGLPSFFNVIITETYFGLRTPAFTLDRVSIFGGSKGVETDSVNDGTWRNLYIRGCIGQSLRFSSITVDVHIINGDLDVWSINWVGASTAEVYRQYEFDLNVTDTTGTPIQNANVTISHYGQGGGQDFTILSGSNGSFATQTLTLGFYNQTGAAVLYDYSPFNITITSTTGHRTYTKNFTFIEQLDWTIRLADTLSPVAAFTFTPSNPDLTESVSFDASSSWVDSHTNITVYDWDFGDGASTTGQTATHKYQSNATFTINLTITDAESNIDTLLQDITVRTVLNPIAVFSFSPTDPDFNDVVTFDASASWSDPYTNLTTYDWDFGDTKTSSVAVSDHLHTYLGDGAFTVTLTVTDAEGSINVFSQIINVVTIDTSTGGSAGGASSPDEPPPSDEPPAPDVEEPKFVLPPDSILLLNFTEAQESFTFLPQYIVTPNWFPLALLIIFAFCFVMFFVNEKTKKKKKKPKRKTGKFEGWPAKKPGGWPVRW